MGKGVEKAELDKCSGKDAIIRLAETKGLIESLTPAVEAPVVAAAAVVEAAPPEAAPAPAAPANDPFAACEGTMQEKELAYLCDWIKNNGRAVDGDGLVGNIRRGRKEKKLKSVAEVFF